MNSLKTTFVVAVLIAIAAVVYVSINNNPQSTPTAAQEGWNASPSVEPGSEFSPDSQTAGLGSLVPPFSLDQSNGDTQESGSTVRLPEFSDDPNAVAGSEFPHGPSPSSDLANDPMSGGINEAFARFMEAAYGDFQQGELTEVHETLSLWYDKPQLTPEQSYQVTELLDQVAGAVVYSRQHRLERAYEVKPGDTLQRIANSYGVPWQLLANINGIQDPQNLEAGQKLKVVRGPFDAVIHLDRYEMTLMLRGLYAGRFEIGVGRYQNLEGTFFVDDKGDGNGVPRSLMRKCWIKLDNQAGGQLAIEGTDDPREIGTSGGAASICLSQRDIEDVHDILSVGSRISIVR